MKRFRKAQCPVAERLVNSLMMHGRNNGKKVGENERPLLIKHDKDEFSTLTIDVFECVNTTDHGIQDCTTCV